MLETDDADGGLRLSPAYDILCSKAVLPKETDCALTVNGKHDKITRRDFLTFGEALRIPPKVVSGILERFSQGHSMVIDEIPHSRLSADLQEKVRQVVEERHQRLFGH